MKALGVCVFGEVLFDVFPAGNRVLGGAPFNLAWHLQAFGQAPRFISRVGNDEPGRAVHAAMSTWGMDTRSLQDDPQHPTGRVDVHFEKSDPRYEIVPDCAYDFIADAHFENLDCRILCHGSLGLRSQVSAESFRHLRKAQVEKVFLDVNLRDPWWQREAVLALVKEAHWVKMNDHELRLLSGEKGVLEEMAQDFRARHQLECLVITRAESGALAVTPNQPPMCIAPSEKVQVVDTVGAGDAFSSVLVLGLAKGWPLALTMERAQSFASLLVGQQGATVEDIGFYRPFIADWQLDS